MGKVITFHTTLSGPDLRAIVLALADLKLLPKTQPNIVRVDSEPHDLAGEWLDQAVALALTSRVHLSFPDGELLEVAAGKVVNLRRASFEIDPQGLAELLAAVPFELAAFSGLFSEWGNQLSPAAPKPRSGFGHGHLLHGWGCALRGAGHDQLVSRKWLEYGPWRLFKGPNDTSLVQFHDLDADAETAAKQAGPGFRCMGSHQGGFIQRTLPLPKEAPGDYVHETRELVISIYGREVTAQEMLIARAIQVLDALGEGKPIDRVVFSFAEEGEARTHLHDLWLRGLVCETFVDGNKVRLTDDYDPPPPTKPDWVAKLES
jgi:hypothetical protein